MLSLQLAAMLRVWMICNDFFWKMQTLSLKGHPREVVCFTPHSVVKGKIAWQGQTIHVSLWKGNGLQSVPFKTQGLWLLRNGSQGKLPRRWKALFPGLTLAALPMFVSDSLPWGHLVCVLQSLWAQKIYLWSVALLSVNIQSLDVNVQTSWTSIQSSHKRAWP